MFPRRAWPGISGRYGRGRAGRDRPQPSDP